MTGSLLFFLICKLFYCALCLFIQHLPVIICTGILLRFVLTFDKTQTGGGDIKKKFLRRPHSVRRRTFNKRDVAQIHNQDTDQPLSSIIHKELLGELDALEQCKQELLVFRQAQSMASKLEDDGNQEKVEGGEETEGREDGWAARDENGVESIDHEISESERYKRLESMIKRREARKLLGLGSEKDGVAPIGVTRSIDCLPVKVGNESSSPGSAPSILLPRRRQQNPFDLPYDPLEEKPDLSEDGFESESTMSFSLGASLDPEVPRHVVELDNGRIVGHGLSDGGCNSETADDHFSETNGYCVELTGS